MRKQRLPSNALSSLRFLAPRRRRRHGSPGHNWRGWHNRAAGSNAGPLHSRQGERLHVMSKTMPTVSSPTLSPNTMCCSAAILPAGFGLTGGRALGGGVLAWRRQQRVMHGAQHLCWLDCWLDCGLPHRLVHGGLGHWHDYAWQGGRRRDDGRLWIRDKKRSGNDTCGAHSGGKSLLRAVLHVTHH